LTTSKKVRTSLVFDLFILVKSKSKIREFSTQSKSDLRHGLGISLKLKKNENELDEEFMRKSMKRFIAHQDV
jgi:hypothetical protein